MWLRKLGAWAPVLTFAALFIFFFAIAPSFRKPENFTNILQQNAPLAIMAVGVTFVLLCAEIDLSIAAMAMLSGVVCAKVYVMLGESMPGGMAAVIGIIAAAACCGGLGTVSGLGTARLGLPSFMITMAMWLIAKGLALRITEGKPIFDIPELLESLGVGGNIVILAIVALTVGFVVLRYTRFGRYVYMVGGNRQAAELAGVNVKGITTACLAICGFTAGLSGLVIIGRQGSAQAIEPEGMLINCISAVVLGGTSLFGGKGGIGCTVIGLLTLGVLRNGLNHVDINIYLKEFISGVILLGALLLNVSMARIKTTD